MEAFLDAISAAPEEDAPRYVLADLLLHRADPLGEVLSLQVRQAALGIHFEPTGAARLRELFGKHAAALPARFFGEKQCDHAVFHRGLPAVVRATASAWLRGPDPAVPLDVLELSDVLPQHLAPLLQRASTRQLKGLRLRAIDGERWSEHEAELLGAAQLPRLQHLGLFHCWKSWMPAHAFYASALPRQLTSIELGHALSTDPVRVLQALMSNTPQLAELSLYDDLPVSIAPLVARVPVVMFPDSFVRLEISATLAPRTALYLPPHVKSPPTKGGPKAGRWRSVTPLGVRNGLDASFAREERTGLGGLLVRTRTLTGDFVSPQAWLEPNIEAGEGSLGPIDAGVSASGAWAVFSLACGERLDRLVEREGKLPLSHVAHAAAWARVARLAAVKRETKALPLSQIFAGPRGLQVQPLGPEIGPRRRSAATFTRSEVAELSPEAVRGQPVDEKNVVWTLAMQICRTAGIRIYGDVARTDLELLQQIMTGPPIALFGHGLPSRLRETLTACLNRDRKMRPTLHALADALAEFDGPDARAELARLPDTADELEHATAQAEGWLEGRSVHDPEPRT